MERIRRFIRVWLGFSRTETNGFLILLPLLFVLILSKPVYQALNRPTALEIKTDTTLARRITLWETKLTDTVASINPQSLRKFNPNTEPINGMLSLGFEKHLAMRIAGYRAKGGTFRVKRDLLKIYGVDSTLYTQMQPFIDLPDEVRLPSVRTVTRNAFTREGKSQFDLNTADTAALMAIKGIGRVLSQRIIRFRDGLGGFVDKDQLKEVYGLDSLTVGLIHTRTFLSANIRKLNLNSADERTLSSHPYIKKRLANAIITYRFQHGRFSSVTEIANLALVDPPLAEKLIPYLTVTD